MKTTPLFPEDGDDGWYFMSSVDILFKNERFQQISSRNTMRVSNSSYQKVQTVGKCYQPMILAGEDLSSVQNREMYLPVCPLLSMRS